MTSAQLQALMRASQPVPVGQVMGVGSPFRQLK